MTAVAHVPDVSGSPPRLRVLLGAQLGHQVGGHDLDRERPLGTVGRLPHCLPGLAICVVHQFKRLEGGLLEVRVDDPA